MKTAGVRISPSQRLGYCALLRKLWAADPLMTLERARKESGAPGSVVIGMRKRLVKEGRLAAAQHQRRDVHEDDPGEQGLSAQEKEVLALRNRVRDLEVSLEDALSLYTELEGPNTYERYRAACAVLEAR